MESPSMIVFAAAIAFSALSVALMIFSGSPRGLIAGLLRAAWTLPILLALYPRTSSEELPPTTAPHALRVLVDDSSSMSRYSKQIERVLDDARAACATAGCQPVITRLSELDGSPSNDEPLSGSNSTVAAGYTPLARHLETWMTRVSGDPWMVLTDGGDSLPTEDWPTTLTEAGTPLSATRSPRGFIAGFGEPESDDLWIDAADIPPFAFEDKPLTVRISVSRGGGGPALRVQAQVRSRDNVIATTNVEFGSGDTRADGIITVPPLPRGQHLLTALASPPGEDHVIWNNVVHMPVEVMPNTVGVLHLLGSPGWDGRFMRRYLKSEPKFDLISFFILRDPWDSQQVNERELSLIPFPVERLFKEELPNFRVVILQNFGLHQFLQPEYQENLVRFVNEGGGLLFIGGPRSLPPRDLASSPLRSILPFRSDGDELAANPLFPGGSPLGDGDTPRDNGTGPFFDASLAFQITPASPTPHQRALASVIDDWEPLFPALREARGLRGLHHMERVEFKSGEAIPLLNARVSGSADIPLAVASCPGKGRALWFFTDSLWRLAMAPQNEIARETETRLLDNAMTWLARQEMRKPLIVKSMRFGQGRWNAMITGPAARYFSASASIDTADQSVRGRWEITVCRAAVPVDAISTERLSDDQILVHGPLPRALEGGERCDLEVAGEHPAFGSARAGTAAIVPRVVRDSLMGTPVRRLDTLARLTGARLERNEAKLATAITSWVDGLGVSPSVPEPKQFRTTREHFWMLRYWWFWALALCLPLEVITRRWRDLTGDYRPTSRQGDT